MLTLPKIIILLFLSLPYLALSQEKEDKLKITHLTGNFYIFTTYNTFENTTTPANGMYLITEDGILMFDSPWDSTQFQPLLDSIESKSNKKVIFNIATHSHEDRANGIKFWGERGASTYTSSLTDELLKKDYKNRADFTFKNDTVFHIGHHTFEVYYPGEGHTKDNIVVWFLKEKILYGGCLIKSTEADDLGYIKEANLKEWPASINRLKNKFKNPNYVIPGHLSWSNKNSINHTLMLLKNAKK